MPAHKPEELPELYVQALNSGDLDALVALFEPEACISPAPGQVVAGAQAIREALSAFLAMKPKLTQEVKTLNQTSDIAISTANWHLTGTGPDSNPVDVRGQSVAVLRRQSDGTWSLALITPSVSAGMVRRSIMSFSRGSLSRYR
jgi:uncharacterized protein (TIGR02246 family)